MRILVASDAWDPQVNGVLVTLRSTEREMRAVGHVVDVVVPGVRGMLNNALRTSALGALAVDRATVRQAALCHSWQNAMAQFLDNLSPHPAAARAA